MARGYMPRLFVAALVSSAAAGALLALFFVVGGALSQADEGGPMWEWAWLLELVPLGSALGSILAGLPAWLAGGLLWALGERNPEARHWTAWAATGAAVGWAAARLTYPLSADGGLVAFLLTGAAAACYSGG
jgi:hypothetical protein